MEELEIIKEEIVPVMDLQLSQLKIEIDSQVATAKRFPRDVKQCLEEAVFTATMDYETADSCMYALPRGGKLVPGPSVRLAEIILQSWGNMRAEMKVISESDRHVESEAYAWDLQKNNAVKVTVKRSIMTKTGRMNDDMITVTGNAANSISFRNAIFKIIPKAIVNKVYSAVQVKIIGGEGEFAQRLKDVLKAFKTKYGRENLEVLKLVGKMRVEDVEPGDLAVLIGLGTSLRNGDLTVEALFKEPAKTGDQKKADLKKKQEAEKEAQPEAEVKAESETPPAEEKQPEPEKRQPHQTSIKLP